MLFNAEPEEENEKRHGGNPWGRTIKLKTGAALGYSNLRRDRLWPNSRDTAGRSRKNPAQYLHLSGSNSYERAFLGVENASRQKLFFLETSSPLRRPRGAFFRGRAPR